MIVLLFSNTSLFYELGIKKPFGRIILMIVIKANVRIVI